MATKQDICTYLLYRSEVRIKVVVLSGRVLVEDMHAPMVWCFRIVWWSRTDACTHGVVSSGRVVVKDRCMHP